MMPVMLRRGDFVSGLALAALGAFIVVQALGWEYTTPDGPGAGFFPRWYGIAMIVLSLALVARSLRAGAPTVTTASDASYGRALTCWATLVGCILLSKLLGFFVSFALLCWFVGTLLFAQRQRTAIPFALGSAIVFWLVFDVALDVALPRGPWGL
jgi:putative tricarboxylic transport membrane protein